MFQQLLLHFFATGVAAFSLQCCKKNARKVVETICFCLLQNSALFVSFYLVPVATIAQHSTKENGPIRQVKLCFCNIFVIKAKFCNSLSVTAILHIVIVTGIQVFLQQTLKKGLNKANICNDPMWEGYAFHPNFS